VGGSEAPESRNRQRAETSLGLEAVMSKLKVSSTLVTLSRLSLPILFVVFSGGETLAQVTLTDNGTTVTLANPTITAVVQKANGQVTSLKRVGLETVMGNIYYSMDGGAMYQQPGPCTYSVTTQTTDLVDSPFSRCIRLSRTHSISTFIT
jgi:hypothetical protein